MKVADKITHNLQQKVIQQYKNIIEHQADIIDSQRSQIAQLEQHITRLKSQPIESRTNGIEGWRQRMELFFKI